MERKTQKNKGGKKTQIINKKSLERVKKKLKCMGLTEAARPDLYFFFIFIMSFTLFFFEKQYDLKAFNCFH